MCNKKSKEPMKKYIVEAPAPRKGQSASSGGIREGGKLAVQYKNPIPYNEPQLPSVSNQNTTFHKSRLKSDIKEWGIDILELFWHEFAKPVIKAKLIQKGTQLATKTLSETTIKNTEPIDVDFTEAISEEIHNEHENIINFPQRNII